MLAVRLRACRRPVSRVVAAFVALGSAAVAAGAVSCAGDALDPDRPAVASLAITPSPLTVAVGAAAPLTAETRDAAGAPLPGRKIAWASQDPSVATVSGTGVVTGVRAGSVRVAATSEGKSAVVDVTVTPKAVASIRLTPSSDLRLLVGQTQQMTAEPLDADGGILSDRALTWSSNAPAVATVSTEGLITGVAPGGAVITVASEGKTALAAVTVSPVPVASVVIAPESGTVVVSQTLQLTATAKDADGGTLTDRPISWSSSDANVATVSSTGLLTAVAPGQATVTATSEGKSGTATVSVVPRQAASVQVSPSAAELLVGDTTRLTAIARDASGNVLSGRSVTWSSSSTAVATVSPTGLVTAVAPGEVSIFAEVDGKLGSATVTVPGPVETVIVSPNPATVKAGDQVQLTATLLDANGIVLQGRSVTWRSSNSLVATVDGNGLVRGIVKGKVTITATSEGKRGTSSVTVQ